MSTLGNNATSNFSIAYQSYYDAVAECVRPSSNILEIGGGAHPSLQNRKGMSYTIVDPDTAELRKCPDDVKTIDAKLQDLDSFVRYDLVISKMVLEHIEHPDTFHNHILQLLKPNGKAIHFFACKNSIPGLANRILSEENGDRILKILSNRDLTDSPKYEAYYKRTKGHTADQLTYFDSLGYSIDLYHSFVGHKYFQNIPILAQIERVYTNLLSVCKVKELATVALIVLSVPKRQEHKIHHQ